MLVEQYFYPEGWGGAQIPRDIALAWREAGFAVSVLCGTEQYVATDDAGPDPAAAGITILRVPRLLPGAPRTARMLRTLWFCLWALVRLLARRRARLIVTQTNPPLIVPVTALAAAIRRIPLVIIAQDLYPEVLIASGSIPESAWPTRLLEAVFSRAYRRASRVVVLGPCMERRVRAKGVAPERLVIISNWATGHLEAVRQAGLRARLGLEDAFVVLYTGNLGRGHEFATLLEGVRRAAGSGPRLTLVFVGGGARRAEVERRAAELGLDVRFLDHVSAQELPAVLGLAQLGVVTLRAGFEGVIVPSKLFGYLARGLPTLYIGPEGDMSEVIRAADCGAVCAPGDAAAVAAVLERARTDHSLLEHWGQRARAAYARRYDRTIGLAAYVSLAAGALREASP
ncbi:MAG TPA: glycosyltransferase family 4 protein [Steroidobacteraceae bacterium]|nr:glycosyltransferase family 4 protein [Steroidobacteraceae bacterium]